MENFSENNETRQIVPNYRSSSKLNNSGKGERQHGEDTLPARQQTVAHGTLNFRPVFQNRSSPQNYISSNNLDSNSSGSNNTNASNVGNINNNDLLNSRFKDNKGNNSEIPIIEQDKFIPVLQRSDYRLFPNCDDEDLKPE